MMKAEIKFTTDPIPRIANVTKQLQNRAIARAIKQAIRPVQDAVESNAGSIQRYGFLRQSIGNKVKRYRTSVAGIIGPTSKFRRRKGVRTRGKEAGQPIWHRPAFYAALVEKGTKHSRARPFLKPALERTQDKYLSTVAETIKDEIAALLP